jgi:hypothetical protein
MIGEAVQDLAVVGPQDEDRALPAAGGDPVALRGKGGTFAPGIAHAPDRRTGRQIQHAQLPAAVEHEPPAVRQPSE